MSVVVIGVVFVPGTRARGVVSGCSVEEGKDLYWRGIEVDCGHGSFLVFAGLVFGRLMSCVFLALLNGSGKSEVVEVDGAWVAWTEGFVPMWYVELALSSGR